MPRAPSILFALALMAASATAHAESRQDYARTWVFVVGLAQFEGEADDKPSFSKSDRLDGPFVELLVKKGVPRAQTVLLTDRDATTAQVRSSLDAFLKKPQKGDKLLFYFGSHGGFDRKTGVHSFSTFDGSLPMSWLFDSLDSSFRGDSALLFADSCYSGGLVDHAAKRAGRVAYAALSSTAAQNVAWSRWRFVDVMMRSFAGNPLVDLNSDGRVDVDEMFRYARQHMAFVAEGMPQFVATRGFDPHLVLADAERSPKHPDLGRYVEVQWRGSWYKAEILAVDGTKRKVHYTDYGHDSDEWVEPKRIRAPAFPSFQAGSKVEIQSSKKWYPGVVKEAVGSLHHCSYDGWDATWDEWIGPSRIRPLKAK